MTDTRKRSDWANFVRDLVDGRYSEAEGVVLVMDQLNTHFKASLYEAFAPAEAERVAVPAGGPPHPEARQLAEHGRD